MTTVGPNYTSPSSDIYTISQGSVVWANIANAGAADGVFATCTTTSNAISDLLVFPELGFSIPTSATINGIMIEVSAKNNTASTFKDVNVAIDYPGSTTPSNLATNLTTTFTTTNAIVTYGGPTQLWGLPWTPTDVNDPFCELYFGIQKSTGSTSRVFSVDYLRATVYYTASGTNWAVSSTISAVSGFSASVGLKRPLSSTLTAASALSGGLGLKRPLTGSLSAVSGVSGTLKRNYALGAGISSMGLLSGSLKQNNAIASNSISAASSVSATILRKYQLASLVTNTSGVSGSLVAKDAAVSNILDTSMLSGNMGVKYGVSSLITNACTISGALTVKAGSTSPGLLGDNNLSDSSP